MNQAVTKRSITDGVYQAQVLLKNLSIQVSEDSSIQVSIEV